MRIVFCGTPDSAVPALVALADRRPDWEIAAVLSQPDRPAATAAAEGRARVTMRARHQLGPDEEDDFDILSPDAARGFVQVLSERIGVAAAPISAMALLAALYVDSPTTTTPGGAVCWRRAAVLTRSPTNVPTPC